MEIPIAVNKWKIRVSRDYSYVLVKILWTKNNWNPWGLSWWRKIHNFWMMTTFLELISQNIYFVSNKLSKLWNDLWEQRILLLVDDFEWKFTSQVLVFWFRKRNWYCHSLSIWFVSLQFVNFFKIHWFLCILRRGMNSSLWRINFRVRNRGSNLWSMVQCKCMGCRWQFKVDKVATCSETRLIRENDWKI